MTRTVREPFLCSNYKSIQSKIESYCEACKIKCCNRRSFQTSYQPN